MADEIKPHEQMIRASDPVTGVSIRIGADVYGTDGKLGEVDKVIADAKTDRVTDIVVKHGFVFKTERIVPLINVVRQDGDDIYVSLDQEAFKRCAGFAERRFEAASEDYVGTPGFDNDGAHRGNLQFESIVAMGSAYSGGKIMGFPGGERLNPDLTERPTVEDGTDVFDVTHQKVGDVSGLVFASDDGEITGMRIKSGFILKKEVQVPAAWVEDVTAKGVILNVGKEEVEALQD